MPDLAPIWDQMMPAGTRVETFDALRDACLAPMTDSLWLRISSAARPPVSAPRD
jgi:hypothetical protein